MSSVPALLLFASLVTQGPDADARRPQPSAQPAGSQRPAANPAKEKPAPPPASSTSPRAAPTPAIPRAARLQASHRVDVIAPGEKIETVIDRMRTRTPRPVEGASGRVAPMPARGPASSGAIPPGLPPTGYVPFIPPVGQTAPAGSTTFQPPTSTTFPPPTWFPTSGMPPPTGGSYQPVPTFPAPPASGTGSYPGTGGQQDRRWHR